MPSTSWYVNRLRAMSLDELTWRARGAARDRLDRLRVSAGVLPPSSVAAREAAALVDGASPRLTDVARGGWSRASGEERRWHDRLLRQADAIAAHRIVLFGRERDLGTPIDWNRDHERNQPAPLGFAPAIDYRDVRIAGDAKLVWEPSRHQHLVVLARAYRACGEARYAAAAIEQLTSWLDQCPFGRGMNWRSPLELAIRLISWTWTLDLIRDSGAVTSAFAGRFAHAIYLHVWDVTRKYSRGSSANNHLIGEAAGVFVATSYFQALPGAAAWRDDAYDILCRQILAQTYADGGTREQAASYHLFSLYLLLVAGMAGRATGRDFPPAFWSRLEKMLEFARAIGEAGPAPAFGDSDDGYVIDLGREHDDLEAALCIGALRFARGDFKRAARGFREPARWLMGSSAAADFERLEAGTPRPLESRAFPETGYYLLQAGTPDPPDDISVMFDCGPLGFGSLAAHGHADALSLTVRAFGRELLVDPGTFDYFTYPAWRDYFRSTAAHNTVTIDGRDQSVPLGAFLWGSRAEATCLEWTVGEARTVVAGEQTGYRRLDDGVVHRRRIELEPRARRVLIRDELLMRGAHDVALWFHFSEDCRVVRESPRAWSIGFGPHAARLVLDDRLAVDLAAGQENPIRGWVSRGYHVRQPSATLCGRLRAAGPTAFESVLEIDN